jgi:hypothetical protein
MGAAVFLLAGCNTLCKGRMGKVQYERDPHPKEDRGRIAVVFHPDYLRCRPATEWRLLTADGPEPTWHPVKTRPAYHRQPVNIYGIEFQLCDPKPGDKAPGPGTVTLLENKKLLVPIFYR